MENFRHKILVKVQFHEVDMVGVCNNAVYFNYFETARLEYLKSIGYEKDIKEVGKKKEFFLIAHNDCDYIEPAFYDDELTVFTRVSFTKNSSFGFEHIIENQKTRRIIAKGSGVMVYIGWDDKKSIPLPDEFVDAVNSFEKTETVNQ